MIAFIKEQDARLCDRTLRSKYFSYIGRRSENWLKQAVLVLVVPFSVLKALGCSLFGSLCNKQLLLSLPAGPLPQDTLPDLACLRWLTPRVPGQRHRKACCCVHLFS